MEFVTYQEAFDALSELGICEIREGDDALRFQLANDGEAVHLHLACPESKFPPHNGATILQLPKDRLSDTVEHLIHKLHLHEVLLIPIGKWRKVFDAVAFSLANNEDWREVDTMATVELNTRDPLLCGPADFHTINALIKALLTDAEAPDQGFTIVTTAAPVMMEVIPDGAVRISVGNAVLADEVAETVGR